MQDYNARLKIDKAKDIKIKTYKFALSIIDFSRNLKKEFVSDILMKQLLRSGTSVGANIIEAQSASSKKDFINYINHSLESANETKFWLCLLRDSNTGDRIKVEELLREAVMISNILAKIILNAKNWNKF